MAIYLNTARITATFPTWTGGKADVENPVLIAKEGSNEIERIPFEENPSIGVYAVDYVIPEPTGTNTEIKLIAAGMLEGKPIRGGVTIERTETA